jgi:glutamate-ammonia-ligase adenylyltransferase
MQEIELVAQAGALMAAEPGRNVAAGLKACVAIGWLDDADRAALAEAYGLCWCVLQAARLLTDKPLDPDNLGEGATAFLLRETKAETLDEVQARLVEVTGAAAEIIDAALADEGKDEA